MRFDFNEVNILKQNLFKASQSKDDLLELLKLLAQKTEDYILGDAIVSLQRKVSSLSLAEFDLMKEEIINKKVVATMDTSCPGKMKKQSDM